MKYFKNKKLVAVSLIVTMAIAFVAIGYAVVAYTGSTSNSNNSVQSGYIVAKQDAYVGTYDDTALTFSTTTGATGTTFDMLNADDANYAGYVKLGEGTLNFTSKNVNGDDPVTAYRVAISGSGFNTLWGYKVVFSLGGVQKGVITVDAGAGSFSGDVLGLLKETDYTVAVYISSANVQVPTDTAFAGISPVNNGTITFTVSDATS